MSPILYINNLSIENIKEYEMIHHFSDIIKDILLWDNIYPVMNYSDQEHLFVIVVPIYNDADDSIMMVECDIIKNDNQLFIITNTPNLKIDTIIQKLSFQTDINVDDAIFTLLLELCGIILSEIDALERRLLLLQKHSQTNDMRSDGDIIHTIMQLKLAIGMLKSTITPFIDIIEHIFDTVDNSVVHKHKTQKDQLDQLIKQIQAQSLFLYENITIISDTYAAIQNNNVNNVMKILTIISSIFIPLSFIVGFFGMNFTSIPGDNVTFFYGLIFIMIFIWSLQLYVFKKKWWL